MNTLKIPTGWDQISLGQFIELSQVTTDDIADSVKIISILSDIDPEEVMKMQTEELKGIIAQLAWMNILPESVFKHTIKVEGVDYGIVPELNALTVGEWVDLEEFINDYPNSIHKVMAVLYRPVIYNVNDTTRFIEKYEGNTTLKRAELFFDKMMISDVYGASLFFSLTGMEFIRNLNTSLQRQTEEMKASMI